MDVGAEPRPAALPLPGGSRGATVRLTPLLTGEIMAPPGYVDRPSGRFAWPRILATPRKRWLALPVPAFLVEHPSAGAILIDTGFHASVAVSPRESLGAIGARIFDVRMSAEQAVPAQLERLGLGPQAVRVVIMTHLHLDHASGVSEFAQATFVVDRREWDAASTGGWRQGYHARQFDHAFDWRALDYDAAEVDSFAGFGASLDLFGDGSVRLLSTPGHTAGHQSVLLRLSDREALVCGDAAYLRRAIADEVIPMTLDDEHRYRRSLREIARFVERTPRLVVIPGHDPDAWAELERSYE